MHITLFSGLERRAGGGIDLLYYNIIILKGGYYIIAMSNLASAVSLFEPFKLAYDNDNLEKANSLLPKLKVSVWQAL